MLQETVNQNILKYKKGPYSAKLQIRAIPNTCEVSLEYPKKQQANGDVACLPKSEHILKSYKNKRSSTYK